MASSSPEPGPIPMGRRALKKASGAACFAASLVAAQPSGAVEYGVSNYFLGLAIPMCGYVPPPGVYFWNSILLYQGTIRGVTIDIASDIIEAGWFANTELSGATIGLVATIPVSRDRNSIPPGFPQASGFSSPVRQTAEIIALGDTDYSGVIGWHSGKNNWAMVLTAFAPTGNYDPSRFVQTGLNRPALDIKAAYTFLDQETGLEISGALGTTLNARNTATNYQSGIELHFEWAVNQHLPFGLAAGVGGYYYQQLTNDYGQGDALGPFKGRVTAVGPLLSYTFKAGALEPTLSGRWFHEFDVVDRTRGDTIYATLSLPL